MSSHVNLQLRRTVCSETYRLTFLPRENYLYYLVRRCAAFADPNDLHSGLTYLSSFHSSSSLLR